MVSFFFFGQKKCPFIYQNDVWKDSWEISIVIITSQAHTVPKQTKNKKSRHFIIVWLAEIITHSSFKNSYVIAFKWKDQRPIIKSYDIINDKYMSGFPSIVTVLPFGSVCLGSTLPTSWLYRDNINMLNKLRFDICGSEPFSQCEAPKFLTKAHWTSTDLTLKLL